MVHTRWLYVIFFCVSKSFWIPSSLSKRHRPVLLEKDWDAILASEDEDDAVLQSVPRDMRYNNANCMRGVQNYIAIHKANGPGADIYCCLKTSEPETVYWFLGKVHCVSDVKLEECVARQNGIIQYHAANLRTNLFAAGRKLELELYTAQLDSELDVAYNRPEIRFAKVDCTVDTSHIPNYKVGFQGEAYERGEEGFRTWRRQSDGGPARPEIQGPANTAETAEEALDMDRLNEMLKGKDIAELYEEQERRRQADESA